MENIIIENFQNEYKGKTISELRHIISNNHHFSKEEVSAAENLLPAKISEWKTNNQTVANEIQKVFEMSGEQWIDFQIHKYDGTNLILAGDYDLTYGHTLEIIFEDVDFVSSGFHIWTADLEKPIVEIPNKGKEIILNKKYGIYQDGQFFILHEEDEQNEIIIVANKISFNQDTVYYYLRENLKENERLADFVTKQ